MPVIGSPALDEVVDGLAGSEQRRHLVAMQEQDVVGRGDDPGGREPSADTHHEPPER